MGHLTCRVTGLAPTPTRAEVVDGLATAAELAEQAHAAWIDVRAALRPLVSARPGRSASAARAEAADLVVRLGRVVHAAPDWSPTVGDTNRLREPAHLAPHLPALDELLTALHRIDAVSVLIAERHHQLVERSADTSCLLVLTRSLEESDLTARRYSPAPEPVVVSLLQTYASARSATSAATDALDVLQHALPASNVEVAAQRALTRQRIPIEPSWQPAREARECERTLLAVAL
jgi:hypothetical protein